MAERWEMMRHLQATRFIKLVKDTHLKDLKLFRAAGRSVDSLIACAHGRHGAGSCGFVYFPEYLS